MKLLKVSEFFTKDISPFILGGFLSRRIFSRDNKYIFIYSSYKKSNRIDTKYIDYETYDKDYINTLNEESSPYSYWYSKDFVIDNTSILSSELKGNAFFVLENDLNINKDSFYNRLYSKLVSTCSWIFDDLLNDNKKALIRGYMELRGSIDTTANYIAQDYYYDSLFEMKKARLLVDYLSIPFNVMNINFRELQHDYYAGINTRNTQLRINVWWYMENIGILNAYKSEVFAISRNLDFAKPINNIYYYKGDTRIRSINNLLDERLNFYSTKVFGKDISDDDIKNMRSDLGFDDAPKSVRSKALVETIKYLTPDECVCCKDKYDIKDRSYINRNTGRYYFEIHHVISIGDKGELDDENNLVKLCPTCHRALKRGSSSRDEQIELIKTIFKNAPQTLEFAKHYYDSNDYDYIVEQTYNDLK